jgi:signal transduction histidine kinase
MIASGSRLPDVLTTICSLIERFGAECRCCIVAGTADGNDIQTFATSNTPSIFVRFARRLARRQIAERRQSEEHGEGGPAANRCGVDPARRTLRARNVASGRPFANAASLPIYSSTNQVLGAFVVFQNIDADQTKSRVLVDMIRIARIAIERDQNDTALRHSQAVLVEAQRLSSTGSFVWRVAKDEINASRELRELFDIRDSDLLTLDLLRARSHPDDLFAFLEMLEDGRNGLPEISCDFRIVIATGLTKSLRVVGRRVGKDRNSIEYIGAVQDVTQHRSSEEALARARSELARVPRVMSLDAVTASIAHEVNQPLTGIITNTGTCLRMLDAVPPRLEDARDAAARTLRDSRRASQIIDRLRALFAGKATAAEIVDLNQAAGEVIALCRSDLQQQHVSVRTEFTDHLAVVRADRIQIHQVLLNLVLNACDAMAEAVPATKLIVIRSEPGSENSVRLSVTDTGPGMSEDTQLKAFEPMFTTKSGGMGMGLFISRYILERHYGRLDVQSSPGGGATFSLTMPLAIADDTPLPGQWIRSDPSPQESLILEAAE